MAGSEVKRSAPDTIRVAFLGCSRYGRPLDPTNAKKFQLLDKLADVFVIGFSQDLMPRRFDESAHFYLLPKFSSPVLRYLITFTIGPWLAFTLIWRHGVRILVAQSPYEGLAAACAKVIAGGLGWRVALVVESHGDFEEALFMHRKVRLAAVYRFLMRWTARFALSQADLVRPVSDSTREQLARWAPGKPVVQFVAWTDIESFLEAGRQGVQQRMEFVYAGLLIPRKGVHHLINAFAHVAPDFTQARLVLIGRNENETYAAGLRAQVAELGLMEKVTFIDEMVQSDLARHIAQSCALVLPSYSEGLPRVVIEGMAVGVPVIASRVSGVPEVIQDGVTGCLVAPGEESELTDRLRWVLQNAREARAMGQRARSFVERSFTAATFAAGYQRIFSCADVILSSKSSQS